MEYRDRGIKSWSLDDRPREKLLEKGPAVLSNAELLAILLGSGNNETSAVGLAKQILLGAGNELGRLGQMGLDELKSNFKGVGDAKAATVMAALELGRRRKMADGIVPLKIRNSADAIDLMRHLLVDLTHEEFWAIYLNQARLVLDKRRIGQGGLSATVADVRVILRNALYLRATSIILAHNHPSGSAKPSSHDFQLTRQIMAAAELLEISVADHIIIASGDHFSFADNGLMPETQEG